jgi:hypothetical protein
MTSASGTGVLLRHTFDDSPSLRVRLSELFSEEMRLLLERLQDLQGWIVSIGEPRCRRNVKMSESRGIQRLGAKMDIKPGESKAE